MMMEQTFNQLAAMRLHTMARMLREQLNSAATPASYEEGVSMLADAEWTQRQHKALERRLKTARLRDAACLEDVDYQQPRRLDKSVLTRLASCNWVVQHQNIFISGPTGIGKTYLLCALAQRACREGYSVVYHRTPRLTDALRVARADGSLAKTLATLAKVDVLVLDDWGLAPLDQQGRYDLMEVIDDRHGNRSTLIASQLPIADWHTHIGDPNLADSFMDRLVHNAHQIQLSGPSMRKALGGLTSEETAGTKPE
jgi:DNA replication protein DnaC